MNNARVGVPFSLDKQNVSTFDTKFKISYVLDSLVNELRIKKKYNKPGSHPEMLLKANETAGMQNNGKHFIIKRAECG